MNPLTTGCALAESLATLAREWQSAAIAPTLRPTPTPSLEALRDRLNALADDAEAGECVADGQALRRIALLSEVWECLKSEPGQDDAAAEVAAFCSSAMMFLATERPGTSSDVSAASQRVLRESDERWSDYLALVDPASSFGETASEPAEFEECCDAERNEPPAIDAHTLLRLIAGSGHGQEKPPPATSANPPPGGSRSDEQARTIREPTGRPAARPELDAGTLPVLERANDKPAPTSSEPDLSIPPLPTSFDLDTEMREAFLADASELFERIEKLVIGLRRNNDPRGAIDELARCFHTLKGAAGSVGLSELATFVHEMEGRLGQGSGQVPPGLNDLLHRFVGYLDQVIAFLLLRRSATDEPPLKLGRDEQRPESGLVRGETGALALGPAAEGLIRLSPARFDELTDLASELIVHGRFWLAQSESIKTIAAAVRTSRNRLLTSKERLHESGLVRGGRRPGAAAEWQGDFAGQLSRLGEQVDDLSVLAGSVQAAAGSMADRGDALLRLARQLWDTFQSLRIVPIRGLFQRLARVLHDAERVEGRQIELVMVGEDTGVDRAIQDKVFEPLLHLVRNAVGHGIEPPADRARDGKPVTGRVTLEARREGNTIVISVEDDGNGLDREAIADKARRLGWLAPDATPSPEQLQAFIFRPGFSTRSEVNAIAGRGVGMDVVACEVGKMRGTIELASEPGRGTRVTVCFPSQLALETTLIVRVAGQGFAVPASQIESVQPFEPAAVGSGLSTHGGIPIPAGCSPRWPTIQFREHGIPVVFATKMLDARRDAAAPWPMLMVVRTGSRKIGLVVDSIERTEDLVIKPLGALLTGHPLVSGTSLSVTGELISVLNPAGLERWLSLREVSDGDPVPATSSPTSRRTVPRDGATVLVVDDSISVRRGIARQLRGLGFDVHEVSDGVEALSRLRTSSYGLVCTDLEMPRLDGFALLAEMKRSASLAAIPVVAASTKGDAETRRRVIELGALALLCKPVDPRELARTVETLFAEARRRRSADEQSERRGNA
jgi:chemotaxis protein histidine kinase CheA/ActR/RegA family two-component response regulator